MNDTRVDSGVSDANDVVSSAENPESNDAKLDENVVSRRSLPNVKRRKLVFSRRWLFVPPIAIGLLVVYLIMGAKKELPRVDIPEQFIKAIVVSAKQETVQTEVVGFGTAQPSRTWSAVAEVSGRIEWINPSLESGNWVDKGEELLKIDKRDYQLRLEQRQADLDAAKASLEELFANQNADQESLKIELDLLAVTKKDAERVRRLREQNAISISEADTAEGNLLRQTQSVQQRKNSLSLYPSRIASAKASVAIAKSAVAESQRDVDRTVIVSPMSGVLADVDLEAGQVISPNQHLFQIQDSLQLEIEAQISLSQLRQLLSSGVGASANLREMSSSLKEVEALVVYESGSRRFHWKGEPLRLTESLDVQTRTIGVVVKVVNQAYSNSGAFGTEALQPGIPLKSGTYCEVHLFGPPQANIIALPRTAFDDDLVYVVDDESRLRSRKVVRGDSIGERVIVEDGINGGDRVIVRPPIPAIEGMKVKLQ